MSGFLAGLVQRGAGLPARPAEPVMMSAPRSNAPESASYSLEASPWTIDASPSASIDAPGPDPATPPRAPIHDTELAPESVPQVAKVIVVAPAPVGEAPRTTVAPESNTAPRAHVELPPASDAHVPAPVHAQSLPRQPVISTHKPEDVPFLGESVSTAARLDPVAFEANLSDTPKSPRFDSPPRDTVRPQQITTAAAPIATPVRELPETELTAAATAQSLAAPSAPRVAHAAEPPPIHVRIGKVEVRAPSPPATPAPPRKPAAPVALGFAAYRRLRTYR